MWLCRIGLLSICCVFFCVFLSTLTCSNQFFFFFLFLFLKIFFTPPFPLKGPKAAVNNLGIRYAENVWVGQEVWCDCPVADGFYPSRWLWMASETMHSGKNKCRVSFVLYFLKGEESLISEEAVKQMASPATMGEDSNSGKIKRKGSLCFWTCRVKLQP